MSLRSTIFNKFGTDSYHLFRDVAGPENGNDICLEVDARTLGGNYGPDELPGEVAICNLNQETFAEMCRTYLKWHEGQPK